MDDRELEREAATFRSLGEEIRRLAAEVDAMLDDEGCWFGFNEVLALETHSLALADGRIW